MKHAFSLLLALLLLFGFFRLVYADEEEIPILIAPSQEIDVKTIFFTSNVHCQYLQYDRVATLTGNGNLLIDIGDAIHGDVIGSLSRGEYIIDIMNQVGYDLAVPGEYEFAYGMDQFLKIANEKADFPYVCCNLYDLRTGDPVLEPYKIFNINGKRIALVGVTTPKVLTNSRQGTFEDAYGNCIYSFCQEHDGQDLYDAVQNAVADAKANADYVILASYLETDGSSSPWTIENVISNVSGIDAAMNGYPHNASLYEKYDIMGKKVPIIQAGSYLDYAGKIEIAKDGELFPNAIYIEMLNPDMETTYFIENITEKLYDLKNTVFANTSFKLTTKNDDGTRAVRKKETNLGDLCADAYRVLLGADVGFVNGGSIRTDIPSGDITYNNIISVFPFGNMACLAEVTGQQIKDALELGCSRFPEELGGFPQVSGLTFKVNANIESSVVFDERSCFVRVDGEYRVFDIMIGGSPLDTEKTYTLASDNYHILSAGDGFSMLGADNVNILKKEIMKDHEVLMYYISDYLDGQVGPEYAKPQGRIRIYENYDIWDGSTEEPENLIQKDGIFYYEINKCSQLAYIAQSGGEWLTYNYILGKNLILNDVTITWDDEGNCTNTEPLLTWVPIGTSSDGFDGIFNGNGYTISGLYIDNDLQRGRYAGLFADCPNGLLEEISVTNSYVSSAGAGGIAGSAYGRDIINCSYSGLVRGGTIATGGIVANGSSRSTITGCTFNGYIFGSDSVGGIAGSIVGPNIYDCSVNAIITGANDVGGIVGHAYSIDKVIDGCFSTGRIIASGNNAGGIAGLTKSNISNCYSSADVYANKFAGGLAGECNGNVKFSYSLGLVSGDSFAGAFVGKDDGMWGSDIIYISCYYHKDSEHNSGLYAAGQIGEDLVASAIPCNTLLSGSYYSGWDFNSVWSIDKDLNKGFPYLKWQEGSISFVPVSSIHISESSLILSRGDSAYISASALPVNASNQELIWSSSDSSIATVSEAGKITAISAGTAIITTSSKDGGHSASCNITVIDRIPGEYEIDSISARSSSGEPLATIPDGSFWATVSLTHNEMIGNAQVLVITYDENGRFLDMMTVMAENMPQGSTIKLSFYINNANSQVKRVMTTVISSLTDLTPIGASKILE